MVWKGGKTFQSWDFIVFAGLNRGGIVSEQNLLQGTVISVHATPPITVEREHFAEGKLFYSPQNRFLKLNLKVKCFGPGKLLGNV